MQGRAKKIRPALHPDATDAAYFEAHCDNSRQCCD